MAAGLAVLSLGERGLRHECTQTASSASSASWISCSSVTARSSRGPKLLADGAEAALDLGLRHASIIRRRPRVAVSGDFWGTMCRCVSSPGPVPSRCLSSGAVATMPLRPASSCANPRIRHQAARPRRGHGRVPDQPTDKRAPHRRPHARGVLDAGVPPEIQVRVLESGGVMVQYDDTVVGAELEQLRSIGSPSIVVAPAASPLPARIVATAWTWKLSCSAVDLRTLEAFAAERPADAPGLD